MDNQNNQTENNSVSNFSNSNNGNNNNQSQNNQKPFLIWTVSILAVLILAGGGYYFWQNGNQGTNQQKVVVRQKEMAQKNGQKNNQNSKQEINQQGKKIGQNNNNSKAVDPTANWKTYRNEKYGFEMKYPKGWVAHNEKISHPGAEGVPPLIEYTSFSSPNKKYYLIFGVKRLRENIGICPRMSTGGGKMIKAGTIKIGGSKVNVDELVFKGKIKGVFYGASFRIHNDLIGYAEFDTFDNKDYGRINIDRAEIGIANRILSSFRFINPKN